MIIDYQGYPGCTAALPSSSREFESAMAALRCNDPNPMRQYLDIPLKHECEDCGEDRELVGHGKSLVCEACNVIRNVFLGSCYDDCESDRRYQREKGE